jgi:hypothetical protein
MEDMLTTDYDGCETTGYQANTKPWRALENLRLPFLTTLQSETGKTS